VYGPLAKPVRLYDLETKLLRPDSGVQYFELWPTHVPLVNPSECDDYDESDESDDMSQDGEATGHHDATPEAGNEGCTHLMEFQPPYAIYADPHDPRYHQDMILPDPLVYGMCLGELKYRDKETSRDGEAQDTPFLVFLHARDRSLWVVWNPCYQTIDGDMRVRTPHLLADLFWAKVAFPEPVSAFRTTLLIEDLDREPGGGFVNNDTTNTTETTETSVTIKSFKGYQKLLYEKIFQAHFTRDEYLSWSSQKQWRETKKIPLKPWQVISSFGDLAGKRKIKAYLGAGVDA
jgi:hypothetical protein